MSASPQIKRVVVCADDFGLTPASAISILQLAELRAISAASCVVDGAYCAEYAATLARSASDVALGLHLNLTENANTVLNAHLSTWVLRSFVTRQTNPRAVGLEITRQLNVFEEIFNREPDFVDGHEHIHQFPVIRETLLAILDARYGKKVAVRSTVARSKRGVKAALIATLGGRKMQRLSHQKKIATNNDFAGVYDFSAKVAFSVRLRGWLQLIADRGLIMCHPEFDTAVNSARNSEHAFLAADAWSQLRIEHSVQLVPFRADSLTP